MCVSSRGIHRGNQKNQAGSYRHSTETAILIIIIIIINSSADPRVLGETEGDSLS